MLEIWIVLNASRAPFERKKVSMDYPMHRANKISRAYYLIFKGELLTRFVQVNGNNRCFAQAQIFDLLVAQV